MCNQSCNNYRALSSLLLLIQSCNSYIPSSTLPHYHLCHKLFTVPSFYASFAVNMLCDIEAACSVASYGIAINRQICAEHSQIKSVPILLYIIGQIDRWIELYSFPPCLAHDRYTASAHKNTNYRVAPSTRTYIIHQHLRQCLCHPYFVSLFTPFIVPSSFTGTQRTSSTSSDACGIAWGS